MNASGLGGFGEFGVFGGCGLQGSSRNQSLNTLHPNPEPPLGASGRMPTAHSTSCWQHATRAAGSWTSNLGCVSIL